jgi:signal transduction histidine kinase
LQVIFDPLVQLRVGHGGAPDPLPTSLGLGLFIAKEIVAGHGGTLRVQSSRPEGTVFTVTLPRSMAAVVRQSH